MVISDKYRARFEGIGLDEIRRELWANSNEYLHGEEQRSQASEWVAEQEAELKNEIKSCRVREDQTYRYVQWTFFAALAAVVVGIIGVVVTLLH